MTKRTGQQKKMTMPRPDKAWFERKVAELKAEAEKLPADRREQLMRELKHGAGTGRPREIRNDRKLEEAAAHVAYEIETMVFAADHLEWGHSSPAVEPEGKEKDVFLESFLLHHRNLRAFLCPRLRNVPEDDVLASDYLGAETPQHLADCGVLGKDRERINKLLAHISYDRIEYERAHQKRWLVQCMFGEMLEALGDFIRLLPAVRQAWFLKSERVRDALAPDGVQRTRSFSEATYTSTFVETEVSSEIGADIVGQGHGQASPIQKPEGE